MLSWTCVLKAKLSTYSIIKLPLRALYFTNTQQETSLVTAIMFGSIAKVMNYGLRYESQFENLNSRPEFKQNTMIHLQRAQNWRRL